MNFKKIGLSIAIATLFTHSAYAVVPSGEVVIDGFKDDMGEVSVYFTDQNTYFHFLERNMLVKGDLIDLKSDTNVSDLVKNNHNTESKLVSVTTEENQEALVAVEDEELVGNSPVSLPENKNLRIEVVVDLSNAEKVQARTLQILSQSVPNSSITQAANVAQIPESLMQSAQPVVQQPSAQQSSLPVQQVQQVSTQESVNNVGSSQLSDEEVLRNELKRINNELITDSQAVVYKAPNEQYSITVFTDVTCPVCRRFHQNELKQLNDAGVTVRYLMYPRGGLQTDAARLMAGAVCSSDPKASLDTLKRGGRIQPQDVSCTPMVELGYRLGQILQIPGTPTIITQHGDFLPGLVPARDLIRLLQNGH